MTPIVKYHPETDRFSISLHGMGKPEIFTPEEVKNFSDGLIHSIENRKLTLAREQTRKISMKNMPKAGDYIYIDTWEEYSGGLAKISKIETFTTSDGTTQYNARFSKFPGLSVNLNAYIPEQGKLRKEFDLAWATRD